MENNEPTETAQEKRIELSDELRAALRDPELMPRDITIKGTRYVLEEQKGQGFKSVVWRARDDIGRERAIKFAIVEDYQERSYLQELHRAAALDGYDDFSHFIAAEPYELTFESLGKKTFVCFIEEWVEGDTLKDYIPSHRDMVSPSFLRGYISAMSNVLN